MTELEKLVVEFIKKYESFDNDWFSSVLSIDVNKKEYTNKFIEDAKKILEEIK